MRLGVWLGFQSIQLTREMPNLAGFDPWKPGLGLHFHPPTATCTHTQSGFCTWRLALHPSKIEPATSTGFLKLTSHVVRVEPC